MIIEDTYKKISKARAEAHKKRRLHLRQVRAKLKQDARERADLLNTVIGKEPQYKEDDATE